MSAEFDIQKVLFDTLLNDAAITELGPQIVDFGPSEADASGIYPYVAIGGMIFNESDTDTTTGFEIAGRIHTWGDRSAKQVRDIQGAVYDALHLQQTPVEGFTSILLYRLRSEVMRVPSGAFHGVCEYRWLLSRVGAQAQVSPAFDSGFSLGFQ